MFSLEKLQVYDRALAAVASLAQLSAHWEAWKPKQLTLGCADATRNQHRSWRRIRQSEFTRLPER